MSNKDWMNYEEAAAYILEQLKNNFDLSEVKTKQKKVGESGTTWNLEAIGVKEDNKFIIIECRRLTTSKIKQEAVGALALRVKETGADGAILVSPLGLQKGAKKVANTYNIKSIELDCNSTEQDYFVKFLEDVFLGVSEKFCFVESIDITRE
ncbi:MAG: restriction endonuclease [Candidatus Dadabacteria bacterium]